MGGGEGGVLKADFFFLNQKRDHESVKSKLS